MKNIFLKTYWYIFTIFSIIFLSLPIVNWKILSMGTIDIAITVFIKFLILSIILIWLEIVYWKIKPISYNHFTDIHK